MYNMPSKIPANIKRRMSIIAKKKKKVVKKVAHVRTSPSSAPNVYKFTRGFDSFGFVDSDTGIFRQNTDNKYLIISLAVKFSELPDYGEFNALFSEYKINNYTIKLVPNFSTNQYPVLNADNSLYRTEIRNYQAFIIPVNYTDEQVSFDTMSGADIDSYLNQTQRKRVSTFPNKTKVYKVSAPKIVKYDGPVSKLGGTSTLKMGTATWLSTGPVTVLGQADERNVLHYGSRILIRRVDGSALTGTSNPMGWRVHHQVNFSMRKVQ